MNPAPIRLAALAAAAGLLLVGLVGAPAAAEELPDQPEPTVGLPVEESDEGAEEAVPFELPTLAIEVENTVYPEGDWLDGIHVTGSGFIPGIELTRVTVRAGQGTLISPLIEVDPDGAIDVVIMPGAFVGADTPDRPRFMVHASQSFEDGSTAFSNEVQLSITAAAVEAPAEPAAPADQPVEVPADSVDDASKPQLAETGFDGTGSALVALMFVAIGGLALARRRSVSSR
ncbi:hypothetical protein [Agromyces salentinus]|uniref:hypothetical protein n=1 Tax=Agromyces salentinus TaxID=269421 RepID=UPI0012FB0D2D|nr:hypothetical protein [Agromyces salentinus]